MPKIEELHSKVTKPGIYFKMHKEVYHGDKSLSNSGMGYLNQNAQKYWDISPMNANKEPFDTAAFSRGRVMHTLFLEPEKFAEEWTIKPGVQTSRVEGMIGEGDFKDINAAIAKLKRDKVLMQLFAASYPEVSIFWIDDETGVPCRACIDSLGLNLTNDLKSTADLSSNKLRWSIPDYGYHRQAALYNKGLKAIKKLLIAGEAIIEDCPSMEWLEKFVSMEHERFVFTFLELSRPYLYRADILCEASVAKGEAEYRNACHEFKFNYENYGEKEWPSGYEGQVGIIQCDDLRFKNEY